MLSFNDWWNAKVSTGNTRGQEWDKIGLNQKKDLEYVWNFAQKQVYEQMIDSIPELKGYASSFYKEFVDVDTTVVDIEVFKNENVTVILRTNLKGD